MDNTQQIADLKVRMFDIMEAQSSLHLKINDLEKIKAEYHKKLNTLRQEIVKEPKA